MSKVLLADNVGTYYKRKIRCPAHFLVPPNVDVFLKEEIPELRGVSKSAVITYGVKKMRRKVGRDGRPLIDWKKMYELRKQGIVKQPEMSASFFIEHVYDPASIICKKCRGRCLEGKNNPNLRGIRRLNG